MDGNQLRDWLHELSLATTIPTPPAKKALIEGAIPIANMFFSLRLGLITTEALRDFLGKCVEDGTPGGAAYQFINRCKLDESSKLAFVALSPVRPTAPERTASYSTAIPTDRFHRFILHRHYKTHLPGKFPVSGLPPNPKSKRDEESWIRTLQTASRDKLPWAESGAHLGKPFGKPAHEPRMILCWFTKSTSIEDAMSGLGSRGDKANRLRDALGLIEIRSGRSMLLISFPGNALHSVPGLVVAQPTFADAVNDRFAAFQPGQTQAFNRTADWGSTVDLGKFADGLPDACGMPERISYPVPINVAVFGVEYVGRLTSSRGQSSADDDLRFAAWLRQSHTLGEMIDYLVAQVTP